MVSGNRRLAVLLCLLGMAVAALVYTRLGTAGTPVAAPSPDVAYRQIALPLVALPVPDTRAAVTYTQSYRFSSDWFSHNVPLWQTVLEPYRGQPDVAYLEVGLYEGRSALWMLEQILTHPTARLTGIDPFGSLTEPLAPYGATFHANLALSGLSGKATILRDYSQVAMRTLPLRAFDIIYIDGSHTAADALEDVILARRLLKDGGVLIVDDYRWQLAQPPGDRPKVAVDWFYTLFRDEFEVVDTRYQAIFRRHAPVTVP